jgi:hypothetical protein
MTNRTLKRRLARKNYLENYLENILPTYQFLVAHTSSGKLVPGSLRLVNFKVMLKLLQYTYMPEHDWISLYSKVYISEKDGRFTNINRKIRSMIRLGVLPPKNS